MVTQSIDKYQNSMRIVLKLLVILLFLSPMARANEKEDITNLVYKWNELHNTRQTDVFKEIYGSRVLFYGKYNSGIKCFQKKNAFLDQNFHQEIISPVATTEYSSGTIKCSFVKRVTYKNTVKEHDCYLLVEKINGNYRVTGESDLVTDKNLGVKLELGTVVSQPGRSGSLGLTVTSSIIALALLIVLFWWKKRKKEQVIMEDEPIVQQDRIFQEDKIVEKVKEAVLKEMGQPTVATVADAKQKGNDFENYIVTRFAQEYFELVEWRSDKYHEGVYATSSMLPDLEYRFRSKFHQCKFAIECKWRAEFIKGRVEWAKSHQLVTYRQYESEGQVPVFVLLGVGGTPSEPENVYIVPLSEIRSNVLSQYQLINYKRYAKGNFYFDPVNLKLS